MPDLTQYMWIGWLALAVVFIIIELVTLEFTFLMLAAGSLIGGLGVNLLGGPWWLQILAAAVLSVLLLFTIKPLLLRRLHRNDPDAKTNVDALYGLGGRVMSRFVENAGLVKLDNGETWTARLAASQSGRRPRRRRPRRRRRGSRGDRRGRPRDRRHRRRRRKDIARWMTSAHSSGRSS